LLTNPQLATKLGRTLALDYLNMKTCQTRLPIILINANGSAKNLDIDTGKTAA
jgi:hypothetical protein